MRCKCCDAIMTTVESCRLKPNGDYEDLCSACGRIVFMDIENILETQPDYVMGHITENVLNSVGYHTDGRSGSDPNSEFNY